LSSPKSARARRVVIFLVALCALAVGAVASAAGDAPAKAHVRPSKRTVPYGGRVHLRGRFPDAPGARVEIRSLRPGNRHWQLTARTATDQEGRFNARVRPQTTAAWRAQLADPAAGEPAPGDGATPATQPDGRTETERVRVRSRTRARISNHNAVVGHAVRIHGRVWPAGASRRVVVRAGGRRLKTATRQDGRFSVAWHPGSTGSYRVRARVRRNRLAAGSGDAAGVLDVFRRAAASWYGPGFYGHRTACGQTLTPSMLGVANKTLRCGAKVTLRYHGREVRVPVIDRGPYSGNREFDLTQATKNRLHFGSTGTVLSSR
jgi:hypothetical protein